jgi:hypothetical protein
MKLGRRGFPIRLAMGAGVPVATMLLLFYAQPALGIPAFARKYQTSCITCHTIYPKLNPFGEAFRRNGYRFPGVDSDAVKQETVALGQDAYKKVFPNAVWPSLLPASVPLALGFNGQAVWHPTTHSGGATADNGANLNLNELIAEGHLWAGGSFDDTITFFGEMTTSDGGTALEQVHLHFCDLFGPQHAVNLVVGKQPATLSAFGPHSSYIADTLITPLMTTALYGATSDSWNLVDAYQGIELNGILGGNFEYAAGFDAGANIDVRNPNNAYGFIAYKLGGARLDGEGLAGPPNSMKPWAERALTVSGFYYKSTSRFDAADGSIWNDGASTWGGNIRAQWDSLELDVGGYLEDHDHALVDGSGVRALAQYSELAYVVYPWLVPALRFEYLRLEPAAGPTVSDSRLIVGAAALIRANLKLTLTAWIESATGAPDAGWSAAGGMAMPATPTSSVKREVEAVSLGLAFAF